MYDFTKNNDDYITATDPHIADKNREPWRCGVCDLLVFSRDKKGYPTVGAPAPKYASSELSQGLSDVLGFEDGSGSAAGHVLE